MEASLPCERTYSFCSMLQILKTEAWSRSTTGHVRKKHLIMSIKKNSVYLLFKKFYITKKF